MDKHLKIVLNGIAEGVLIADAERKIRFVNEQTCALFGYSRDELLDEHIEMLIPVQLRQRHQRHVEQYHQNPVKRPMGVGRDLYGLRKDGGHFPIEISLNNFDSDGERLALALISDISERKKAEKQIYELNNQLESKVQERTLELKASIHLYESISANFPDGSINVLDQHFNYVFRDGKRVKDGNELIGKSYFTSIPMEYRNEVKENLDSVFQGKTIRIEFKKGESFYEIDGVPLSTSNNGLQQILVVEKDISQLKENARQLELSLEKERNLNTLKSRFVSMASHEFRTPLSSILSSVDLIDRYRKNGETEKQEKHINRIKKSVEGLVEILNDFLSLDKLEEGVISVELENIHIDRHIEELIDEVKPILKDNQKVSYVHQGDQCWEIDRKIFRNIFLNLLSNASKYSGDESEIYIQTQIIQDQFILEVRDQGIGIPPEDQIKLFERFHRASNATNISGTGLGLNIVKKYLQLLNGRITFSSEQNVGSEFKIELKKK